MALTALPFLRRHFLAIAAIAIMTVALPARAQFLRDAETERFFRISSDPLFEAADLLPENVHIYLLNFPSINAFVTGGQNIFVHSGLILAADDVDEFIGVMAHETCHIACGHRVRSRDAMASSTTASIISLVLGAAAIAAGAGDAGMALMLGGQSVAQGQYLAYSRRQEGEADVAGASYLEATGHTATGLIRFFEKLRGQEILAQIRQDPYIRTHPLNRDRIAVLQQVAAKSEFYQKPPDPTLNEMFKRVQAKLTGYLNSADATLRQYPPHDTTLYARYARVYAYHKALEWQSALIEADALIAMEPNNPYFHEIKGQVLFESGQIDDAIIVLRHAASLAPEQPLILTALGQALVSKEEPASFEEAQPLLEEATRLDSSNTFAWFNLARAYGYAGDTARANLATAERYYSGGAAARAAQYARRAQRDFAPGTPEWVRAQDILIVAEDALRRSRGRQRLTGNQNISESPETVPSGPGAVPEGPDSDQK